MGNEIVYTNSLFELDKEFNDERFCKVRIRAMHTGINRNNSNFSRECILNAQDSFKNIPILADVKETIDKDGISHLDYTTHAIHIEDDAFNVDEKRVIYDERVVGLVPEINNFNLVKDEKTGIEYVEVDALLYRDYGNYCVDILKERGGVTDVSMEIICTATSYDVKNHVINVETMIANGITLLGECVKPGMKGSKAELFNLDEENIDSQLIKIMQELKFSLDNYINSKEGGIEDMGKTINLEEQSPELEEESVVTDEELVEEDETVIDEKIDDEKLDDETVDKETIDNETVDDEKEEKFAYSIIRGDVVKEFSITINEKLRALEELVNATYSEEDLCWYRVDADDEYVYMFNDWDCKNFKQRYEEIDDVFTLLDERISIRSIWVTDEEESMFNLIKEEYPTIKEELEKYKQEPQKLEILNSEEYSLIEDKVEFVELLKQENHFDLSIDEVREKADAITLQYAKAGQLNFASKQSSASKSTPFAKNNSSGRYGDIFSE